MKTTKIPDEILHDSEIGKLLIPLAEKLRAISTIQAKVATCFVPSLENGKPTLDPFQLLKALAGTAKDASVVLPSSETLYAGLKQWASQETAKLAATFEPRLKAFCEKHGIKLEGRFPSFVVDGFLLIRASQNEAETEIGIRTVPTLLMDALAPIIKEAITEERNRKVDLDKLLENIYQAYERSRLLHRADSGAPMPIRKLYNELVFIKQPQAFLTSAKKSLFAEYTLEHFIRDLAKLLDSNLLQTQSGFFLTVGPTSFAAEGIPLRHNGEVRIIGKISFSQQTL